MKWIVITSPEPVPGEVFQIIHLIERGADLIHLRKPTWDRATTEQFIRRIPTDCRNRIVLHDHFELCAEYHLRGIHLNRRSHTLPDSFRGSLSCSCHSLEEVARNKSAMDYLFLSPIFNSTSKQDYPAAFTNEQLTAAASDHLIDEKVIALSGITARNIPQVRAWDFGGVAILGDIWNRINDPDYDHYLQLLNSQIHDDISW